MTVLVAESVVARKSGWNAMRVPCDGMTVLVAESVVARKSGWNAMRVPCDGMTVLVVTTESTLMG